MRIALGLLLFAVVHTIFAQKNASLRRRRGADARIRRARARRASRRRARQSAAPVRRPRPPRLALHAAQPQRRRAEGARRARPRSGACAAQERALGRGLPQGRQHHRARARAARDRDVRPDARSRALPPHDLRHAEQRPARGAGASRDITCRSTSRSPATTWPSTRRASSARTRPPCRRGRSAGLRVLAAEEDEARALLDSLSEAQRREAVFDTRTYGEIVTAQRRQGRSAEAGRASPRRN